MKLFVIPYIALGLVLSVAIGVKYSYEGQEMFPIYYGSPFVFKQTSLGSSMEYFYNIFGLILNILTWSVILSVVDKGLKKIIKSKRFKIGYKISVGILFVFSTLNIAIEPVMIGRGFNKNMNYWYWNMDKEAEHWGVIYKGELILFKK